MATIFSAPTIGEPRAVGIKNGGIEQVETDIVRPMSCLSTDDDTCVREMIMQSVGRSYYFKAYQEFMPPSLSKYRCPKVGYPAGPKWTRSGFKVCVQVVSWPALARHRTGRPRREGGGARGAERLGARSPMQARCPQHAEQ